MEFSYNHDYRRNDLTRSQRNSKVEQPIEILPSWNILVTILTYYGYRPEVIDMLQHMSKRSRAYAKSNHKWALIVALKVHRWAPAYDIPEVMTLQDIRTTDES